MATSAPPPVDCPILQFKQLCKLKTCSDRSKRVYKKPNQLIATSSLYGLTFIGEVSGLKIIFSSQIFENLNGLNPKNVVKSYIHRNIPVPSAPSHIDVNSDQQLLSVTYCRNESPFLRVYEIRMLLADTPVVFSEVRLSPSNEYVTDLSWNPAVPNMLTCCISDKTLSVYTFNPNGSFEIKTLPKESNSLCVCWSPKGKQLVVGNDNGYLTQYLPELKAMKNYPPPSNIFDKPCRLCSIKWLSNFQFIGVYELQRPNEEDGDPQTSVIIITTPKNEPVSFINYEDVCFSSGVERPCQFYFIHIASWNMIFVASSNAVEVAVLKQQQDSVSWCQCTLEDSARITLPMSGINETFPVGISVDYSSTIQCPIGENFVPMPIISVLTCEGILCLYVVNYLVPNAPNICVKPSIEPQLTYFTNSEVIEEEVIPAQPTTPVANVTAFSPSQPANLSNEFVTVTPVLKPADIVDVSSAPSNLPPSFDAVSHFVQQSLQSATSAPLNQHITLNQTVTHSTMPINQKPKEMPQLTKITYASSAVAQPTSVSKSDLQAKARQECLARFKKAASTFESDISEIKGLIDHISIEADGHVMPNARLKKLQTDTKRLMKLKSELINEVDAIKVSLVEVFACIQDIKTKYVQLTNPSYRTLLGAQELDPVNATSLKNIENNINYVESQLEKANQQLDEFWCKYNEHSSPTRMKIPILDNVYETMMRQQKILRILELQAEKIQKRITAVKCQAKSNQWMQNKKDLSTFASRAFDDLTLAEFTQKALTIKGDYNEDLASNDAKTLARKFSLEHARRFHLSNSKLLKLQELHGGISVTYIQSSRLQRLKKKSLILLSKSTFTNDSVTEDDGEVAAEIARAPVRQNSEEMRLPLVSPVSSDGDCVADQGSVLGYPSSLSIVSSTPVKDFNKYVAPRFAVEPSISVEVSLPLPAAAKTPSLFSAPKTESDRLFASATITLPSQSKPKVGQSPIVSPLAASGAASTVAVSTIGAKPTLAIPTTTKDAQSRSIFKNFTTSTGASTESTTSKPLFGGEVTLTPVGGSGDDATSSAFPQMPSLFAKSPPTTSSLATTSGGSFFGSLMGTSTSLVSTPTSFFSNVTAASVGAATSSAPVSIFSGSKLGSSGGNLFGGVGTPSSNPPAVSSAPKVSPFSSNNLNVSPSNVTSGPRVTPGVATSPAKSNVTASPAVSASASVVVTNSAASTIFGGTGSIFGKGSLPATSTINFGSILPSANSGLANKPQQTTADSAGVSNDKKTSAFSTFSFGSKLPENTSVTVTEVPPDSPSEGSDADKENTAVTVPTAVTIGGTANSGSAVQTFSFAGNPPTAFASAKPSIFSMPVSSTAAPAPSFTPTANIAPMSAATGATVTPDAPSLLSSILSTKLATPTTDNSISEGSLFQSVPAASEASLPTAAATSASAVTITPIMTPAPTVTTPGIEPVTPEPSPTAENTLPTVLVQAGATSPAASAFESKGSFFEGLSLGATTTTSASTSIFGKPATGSSSLFGGNVFGQSAAQGSAAVETKSIFGSSSLFGTGSATSPESQNLFGAAGNAPFSENKTSIFGSSSVFGSTSTFGNANVNAAPQATNAFGSSSGGMLFSGGATTGLSSTSPSIFQNNAGGFGSPASFGGNMPQAQTAGGFGSPPSFSTAFTKSSFASFGGAATFGGAPAFGGSPTKVFGQAEPNQAAFGNAASPQPTAFENLATENTMSFGNLAQQQPPGFGSPPSFGGANQQPPSFSQPTFGGSSFSSWR